ncbi:hypothetical protein AGMMS49938_08670 [Fibrobacterales bacterium]|nr:hypothetical protein AGMMS49938_08670 [Fibrobacterales bacterium]
MSVLAAYNNFSAELAQNMEPALVVALSEHLNWISEHTDDFPHSGEISQSVAAFQMADGGFGDLEKEFTERLAEWRQKWRQRFETEKTDRVLEGRSGDICKIANAKEKERQSDSLYFDTVHLMVGDAQKLLVTLFSRAELLQEKIRRTWHKNCSNNAYSKILPAIEASLQSCENKFFSNLRGDGFSKNAKKMFLSVIADQVSQSVNRRSFSNSFYNYVYKQSLQLCRFYSEKWALFARGFGIRQNQIPLGEF